MSLPVWPTFANCWSSEHEHDHGHSHGGHSHEHGHEEQGASHLAEQRRPSAELPINDEANLEACLPSVSSPVRSHQA